MILSTSTWLAIASDSFVSMKPTNQKTETTLAERPSYLARRHVLLMLSPIFSRADIIIFCILYYLNHSRMLELSWLSSKTIKWINSSKGINGSKRGFERTRSWNPFWINSVFETVLETDLETLLRNVRLIWLGNTGKSPFSWFLSSSIIPLRVFKKRLYCFNSLLEF